MTDYREVLNGIIEKFDLSEEEIELLTVISTNPLLIVYIASQKQLIAMCDDFSEAPYKIGQKGDEESTARQNYETMLKGMDKIEGYAERNVAMFNKLTTKQKQAANENLQAGRAEEIQEKVIKQLNGKN